MLSCTRASANHSLSEQQHNTEIVLHLPAFIFVVAGKLSVLPRVTFYPVAAEPRFSCFHLNHIQIPSGFVLCCNSDLQMCICADAHPWWHVTCAWLCCRLWETGWKQRYYKNKFDVDASDEKFRRKVVQSYVEGLCWVLRYYYQVPRVSWLVLLQSVARFGVLVLTAGSSTWCSKSCAVFPLPQTMALQVTGWENKGHHVKGFARDGCQSPQQIVMLLHAVCCDCSNLYQI